MATKTRRPKHGMDPVKIDPVLSEPELEKVRQTLVDWHATTCGMLAGLRSVAVNILNELNTRGSPLRAFVYEPRDLEQFIDDLDDADSSLTNLLVRKPLTTNIDIPDPTKLIR